MAAESAAGLRMLPSTDELLVLPESRKLEAAIGRRRLTRHAREAIGSLRNKLIEHVGASAARTTTYTKESLLEEASKLLTKLVGQEKRSAVRKVINATGVIIHTNLGRAPLSPAAIEAITQAAGYCNLEYDLLTGRRGKRGAYVETLLAELTGAEAALVVNNCASAAFFVLSAFAKGGETVVSRGELVEIGGDFRVPDVLEQSGSTLREVGTTNRTKLSDYERAINSETKVILRVHPSNYKIIGFTETPSLADLATLAHRKGIMVYEDAGSGALEDLTQFGLTDEPLISRSIADGADLVTFSGDKLLGASQAGIIVGRSELIEQLRKHPLYRALRVDKLIYAALGATLETHLLDDCDEKQIPVLRMLAITPEEMRTRASAFASALQRVVGDDMSIEILQGESVIGGGSAPDVKPETTLVSLKHPKLSPDEIEVRLRDGEMPVIARIENDRVVIDLRTVAENEEEMLIRTIGGILD